MGPANSCKKAFIRSLETPNIPMPADKFLHRSEGFTSSSGVLGDVENALGVLAIWVASIFISGSLPADL